MTANASAPALQRCRVALRFREVPLGSATYWQLQVLIRLSCVILLLQSCAMDNVRYTRCDGANVLFFYKIGT